MSKEQILLNSIRDTIIKERSIGSEFSSINFDAAQLDVNAFQGANNKLRKQMLSLNRGIEERFSLLKESNKFMTGLNIMERHPSLKFHSPMQAYQFGKTLISIRNPNLGRLNNYIESTGDSDLGQKLYDAEINKRFNDEDISIGRRGWENQFAKWSDDYGSVKAETLRQKSALKNFDYMMMSDKDRHYQDVLDSFYGDTDKADEYIKKERKDKLDGIVKQRRSRDRKSAIAADQAYKFDMMSEDEQLKYTLTKKYGGSKVRADEAYRKILLKNLPSFFKNSTANAATLKRWNTIFKMSKGVPILGKMLGANPLAAGVGLGLTMFAMEKKFASAISGANEKSVAWSNAKNLYGNIDAKFQTAAYLAGMKDPGEISKAYGSIITKFGSIDAFRQIGSSLSGLKPGLEKTLVMQALGFDETTTALLDIFSGNGGRLINDPRKHNAVKNMIEVDKQLGLQSGKGFGSKLASYLTSPDIAANGLWFQQNGDELFNSFMNANNAAESLRTAEKNGQLVSNTTSSQTVTFNINGPVMANDPQQLVSEANNATGGKGTEILENFNQRNGSAVR